MTSGKTGRRLAAACLLVAALFGPGGTALAASEPSQGELRSRTSFRVCADPDNLPFSNRAGEGFENEIAELFAAELGLPVEYVWHPQTLGFIRNTLRAYRCDVVMGVTTGFELLQNTRSYYRSVYVLVYRAEDRARFGSLDSPLLSVARIGVVANTPPAALLGRRGLITNVRSYDLIVDTRIEQPGRQAIADLAAGRIDMALLWGPIAGYWAARSEVPLEWVPLRPDGRAGPPMEYRISMGVRYGETEWRDTLNRLIRKLRPEIRRILEAYRVPLLDRRGRLANPPPWLAAPVRKGDLFAPDGYRIAEYRAPIPGPPEKVEAIGTERLHDLLAEKAVVAVDVLPAPREPAGRDPAAIWLPPERKTVPGAVWLPNVGGGVLPAETRSYFERALRRLTRGEAGRPLAFFCRRDCWMSWNAARRARLEFGYSRVLWYPDGTDGWREAGLPLAKVAAFRLE